MDAFRNIAGHGVNVMKDTDSDHSQRNYKAVKNLQCTNLLGEEEEEGRGSTICMVVVHCAILLLHGSPLCHCTIAVWLPPMSLYYCSMAPPFVIVLLLHGTPLCHCTIAVWLPPMSLYYCSMAPPYVIVLLLYNSPLCRCAVAPDI